MTAAAKKKPDLVDAIMATDAAKKGGGLDGRRLEAALRELDDISQLNHADEMDALADLEKKRGGLDALAAGATEAEADPGRQDIETAILATAAAGPLDAPFQSEFVAALGTFAFSRSDLGAIAGALSDCILEGQAPDKVIILDRLTRAGKKAQPDVLRDILDGSKAVDVTTARAYVAKLQALDRYRNAEAILEDARRQLTESRKKAGTGQDVDAVFGDVAKALFDQAQGRRLITTLPAEADEMLAFREDLERRQAAGLDMLGPSTGIPKLDAIINGLMPGLYIFGGMTSCGKTTLLKQIADHIAGADKVPVLFFSYEQSKEELRIKSLARLAEKDTRDIWRGRGGDKLDRALTDYQNGPGRLLKIVEASREDTAERIRALALMEKRRTGRAPAVILDYLQIVPAVDPLTNGRPFPSVKEKVDFLCSELRRLARDLQAPVLAVSSFNRDAYKNESEKPTLTAFKESGGIEYSADAAFTLWQDKGAAEEISSYHLEGAEVRRIILKCVKNRNGDMGEVKLNFIPAWASFDIVP